MAQERIKRFEAGRIEIVSPAGTVCFEDLAIVECPGVVDDLNKFIRMLKEEYQCLLKDEKMFEEMLKNNQMVNPKKILAIIKTLRIGKEKMIQAAMGENKNENKKD